MAVISKSQKTHKSPNPHPQKILKSSAILQIFRNPQNQLDKHTNKTINTKNKSFQL